MITSKVELEIMLERVKSFKDPILSLEQYKLPASVAADILWYINFRHKDISNKIVIDLGCGTGILSIGAALLNATYVIGIDIDKKAIKYAKEAAYELNVIDKVDFIVGDVRNIEIKGDVVIQNPPFGVRRRSADRIFIITGLKIAPKVYSLHRGGEKVRRFMFKFINNINAKIDEIIPLKIKLPHTYQFHKKKFYEFEVDLYKITRKG
ncbi:MAG: METTL5 family protein [Candidatus Verstraetearchaeota archaeon]|nr:METTL5 family protein [Candidatus Verstraetearchaeota archaeon]